MSEQKGVIYILTNPSFPEYIKIGYADHIERRLQQLNNSECTPFAFRVYATYEVDSRLSDLKIHSIIDKLNPNLRSIETNNGKRRVREFYAMPAEDAFSILEAIAEIHNRTDKLKRWDVSAEQAREEAIAEEVTQEQRAQGTLWTFTACEIPAGAVLTYMEDPTVQCTVVDARRIEYNGEVMYITPFIRRITGWEKINRGPGYLADHFMYNGERIRDICNRLGV